MALRTLALIFLLAGCGNDNSLSGSIGQTKSLQFDSVTLVAQTGAFDVSYNRSNGAIVTRLSVDTSMAPLRSGTVLNGNTFLANATVTRDTGDPNDVFPAVVRGSLTIKAYDAAAGGHCSGSFSAVFDPNGDTLFGAFSGNAVGAQ